MRILSLVSMATTVLFVFTSFVWLRLIILNFWKLFLPVILEMCTSLKEVVDRWMMDILWRHNISPWAEVFMWAGRFQKIAHSNILLLNGSIILSKKNISTFSWKNYPMNVSHYSLLEYYNYGRIIFLEHAWRIRQLGTVYAHTSKISYIKVSITNQTRQLWHYHIYSAIELCFVSWKVPKICKLVSCDLATGSFFVVFFLPKQSQKSRYFAFFQKRKSHNTADLHKSDL